MSAKVTGWALNQPIPPIQKLILVVIADCANDDGTHAFPGQDRIARVLGISVRSVQRHTAELEDKGIVSRKRRTRPDGTRTSDEYIIHMGDKATDWQVGGGDKATAMTSQPDNCVTYKRNHQKNHQIPIAKAIGSNSAVKRKKRSQVPEDFIPSDARKEKLLALAASCGLDLDRELRRFINHHRAKGTVFINHDIAFWNWMDRAQQWAAERKSKETPPDTDVFGRPFDVV